MLVPSSRCKRASAVGLAASSPDCVANAFVEVRLTAFSNADDVDAVRSLFELERKRGRSMVLILGNMKSCII